MEHTYKIASPVEGRKGIVISRYPVVTGVERVIGEAVLLLPDSTPPVVQSEVVMALQRAYRDGREDRSEELLGDQQERPSQYHRVPIPEVLRASWTSQAAHYWRQGVDACMAH
jgi:hypothetical protein